MLLKDVSSDREAVYTVRANERVVFFILNRSGELTVELTGLGAQAHIFAFFVGASGEQTLLLKQRHSAPRTVSSAIVRSVLSGDAQAHYRGLIRIETEAAMSDASQESRALLLTSEARHSSEPSLEILPQDVACHHKASAGPLNPDSLAYLASRGLEREEARQLLVNGFLGASFEAMADLGVPETTLHPLRKRIMSLL